ncbi:MAG: hypothetical protein ACO2ZM_07760 [Francisellaceae bacterium]
MPHCIISCAAALKFREDEMLKQAFAAMSASELFVPERIMTRIHYFDALQTGGKNTPHSYIQVRLLAGRTAAQKQKLAQLLQQAFEPFGGKASVEIIDLAEYYY